MPARNKYQFNSIWYDPYGARTHYLPTYLPHSIRACSPSALFQQL